jgi:hypothetical protein
MVANTRRYKLLGFALVASSALIDLIVHVGGFYKEIETFMHFVIFAPFALGVVVLMFAYLKLR